MARTNLTRNTTRDVRKLKTKLAEHDAALDTIHGAHQALSGAGAVNLTTPVTRFTSTGAGNALTLADGTVNGHRKIITHVVDGGSGVLTAGGSLHLGDSIASITLANAKDWIELEWQTSAWMLIGWGGAGVSFT